MFHILLYQTFYKVLQFRSFISEFPFFFFNGNGGDILVVKETEIAFFGGFFGAGWFNGRSFGTNPSNDLGWAGFEILRQVVLFPAEELALSHQKNRGVSCSFGLSQRLSLGEFAFNSFALFQRALFASLSLKDTSWLLR